MQNHIAVYPLRLFSPPAAQTDDSIAVMWDKPANASSTALYRVYVNGEAHGTCSCTDYTITGLDFEQDYELSVQGIAEDGTVISSSNNLTVKTLSRADLFDITDFGAVGDGQTVNTASIQAAIDACTPNGKVYIPAGIFVTGALYLKSHMTLYLAEGAVLLGSTDIADYPLMQYRFEGLETTCYASLINTKDNNGERLSHITIAGSGKIDANGSVLRKQQTAEKKGKPGRAVCLRNTDHVYLQGITVRQSPAWCVHLIYCNHISINQIQIHTRYDENGQMYEGICNGDGLDPDSSGDIYIFHSMIASQDDCIAVKSGRNEEGRKVGIPSENIRITNCRFNSGFGVAMGSEMSGGVRNVLVQDCCFHDAFSIGSIKCPRGRGGIVENIRYEDCTLSNTNPHFHDCEWFRGAIYIDNFYSHITFDADKAEEVSDGTPVIRDIVFKNITLDTIGGNAVYMAGLPERPLYNICLENIYAHGKCGLKASHIRGLTLHQVVVKSQEDEDYILHDTEFSSRRP